MRVRGGPLDGPSTVFLPVINMHSTLQSGPGVQTLWTAGLVGWLKLCDIWRSVDGGAFAQRASIFVPTVFLGGLFSENVAAGHTYQYQLRCQDAGTNVLFTITAPEVIAA